MRQKSAAAPRTLGNVRRNFEIAAATWTSEQVHQVQQSGLNGTGWPGKGVLIFCQKALVDNRRLKTANSRFCLTILQANHTEERWMGRPKNLSGRGSVLLPARKCLLINHFKVNDVV